MNLFTLEQAEALLPRVREQLVAMQACKQHIDALRRELGELTGKTTGNGHVQSEAGLAEKRRRAEGLVEELNGRLATVNEWGVEIKSIDDGLADFPSDRDGRTVYLCWKVGEDHIGWWHEIDSGFAGRRRLD